MTSDIGVRLGGGGPRLGFAIGALVLLFLIAAPWILPSYLMLTATRIVIIGTFAVAFNVVFGMAGMPSLGHAAFFGVGGYVVGLGLTQWDWSFGTIMVVLILSGLGLGLLFGLLTQRVGGIYLLLLTLAMAQAIWGLAFQQVSLTRGDMGIIGISPESIPLPVASRQNFHYFAVAVCLALIGALWMFLRSPVGRSIVGIRESATRMAALGYRVGIYKLAAFLVSGLVSTFTGALFAYHQRTVGPENLYWILSATVLLAAILGGAHTFLGPALGAAVLIVLETALGLWTARWTTLLGMTFILTIHLLPDGILGTWTRRLRQRSQDEGQRRQNAILELSDDLTVRDRSEFLNHEQEGSV